mmetsp:Transcript_1450/g.3679  ORF Transcript_1450/g.3679 Transcript_1450/m.3679 type:complete len:383 (+) Transcript_1450:121-1269(+)
MQRSREVRVKDAWEEDNQEGVIARVLASPERRDVIFGFSFHNASVDHDNATVAMHLVFKFRYDDSIIEDILGAEKPAKSLERRYGEAHRIFPYCIFNSVSEEPISWAYQNEGGRVYERIELFATLTMVKYLRYFPFQLLLLPLKVGTDGMAKTGLINLKPETRAGSDAPNVDFGIFTKATSALSIRGDTAKAMNDQVMCRMFVRDLSRKSMGNVAGTYTRVYTVFFFQAPFFETLSNLLKYVIVSTVMLNLTSFVLSSAEAILSAVLAISLADIALLFTLPKHTTAITAERVVICHVLYELMLAIVLLASYYWRGWWHDEVKRLSGADYGSVFYANVAATVLTVGFVLREWHCYRQLVQTIKQKFHPVHGQVGAFDEVDREI